MSYQPLNYTDLLYQFVIDHNPSVSPLLLELQQKTLLESGGHMVISIDQMHLLQFLIKLTRAKIILELGTFTGFSALAFALALPEDGRVITCDTDSQGIALGKPYWQRLSMDEKIVFKQQNAINLLTELQEQGQLVDFVFIDADKTNMQAYVKEALKLLSERGLIVVDNTLFHGDVVDTVNQRRVVQHIRHFNDWLKTLPGIDFSLIAVGDGMSLIAKKV